MGSVRQQRDQKREGGLSLSEIWAWDWQEALNQIGLRPRPWIAYCGRF